jgi:hypothetical protein
MEATGQEEMDPFSSKRVHSASEGLPPPKAQIKRLPALMCFSIAVHRHFAAEAATYGLTRLDRVNFSPRDEVYEAMPSRPLAQQFATKSSQEPVCQALTPASG